MRHFGITVFLAAAALGFAALAGRGEPITDRACLAPFPHPRGYVCYRTPSPITVDGKPTEPAWNTAPWSDAFVDIEGDRQPPPRYRTRIKMLWDEEALYIAAELEEPHVWATLTRHDAIVFRDNDFEVFLGPNGNNHHYGELELNALNTTWDLLLTKPYKDGGKAITDWEIRGLKTAVHIDGTPNDPRDTDRGWTVEIKWPWAGLRDLMDREFTRENEKLVPVDGEKWRINFSRVEWDTTVVEGKYVKAPGRPEHNWVWSPQGVIDMHRPERWGYVQFSTAKPGTVAFEPDPDWNARDLLHRVYYAQREYRKTHGMYAKSIRDLEVMGADRVMLEATRSSFEASLPLPPGKDGKPRRLTILNDSRITIE